MRYQVQNRYQDGGWENVQGEVYRDSDTAVSRAESFAKQPIFYGMARVLDLATNFPVKTFSAGGQPVHDIGETCRRAEMEVSLMPKWKQTALGGPREARDYHISPNGSVAGTFHHAAEAWALSEFLTIPNRMLHPAMYQGMLDDFLDRQAWRSPSGRPANELHTMPRLRLPES
jgi:hypothetical protein